MNNQNYIALQIRIHRRAKGLTQDELSRQSGIHYNTIVKLENLTKPANPTIMTLKKIAEVLGVGITTLIGNCEFVKSDQVVNRLLDKISG